MSGYLEGYGAGEAQRERRLWIILGSAIGIVVLGTILYFSFRDYSQEQKLKGFLSAVQKGDMPTAYAFWGCTDQTPCRDYPLKKFLEDWGPNGVDTRLAGGPLVDAERCGTGYIASLKQGDRQVTLWVERATGIVGFAPWDGCPERKLRPMRWLRSRFSGQN